MKHYIIVFCLFLLSQGISGRTYFVRENGSNGNCGFSEDDAWRNLSYAVLRAPDGSTIDIKGSFREPSIVFAVSKKLTIKGDSRQNTIITAQSNETGKPVTCLFNLSDGDSLLLHNMTISRFGDIDQSYSGGAISVIGENSYLYCHQVDFTGNMAQNGGAIALLGSKARIELCNFFDNKATNGQGGAIYAMTTAKDGGLNLTVSRTTFARNQSLKEGSALRVGCGAISTIQTSFLMENCTLCENINGLDTNAAGSYACLFLDGNASYPIVNHTLVNNTIAGNKRVSANTTQATYTTGIYVNNNNNVRLFNNIIFDNQNCDVQQRTTIAHNIAEARNNLIGKVKLKTSVAAFGDISDMCTLHSGNIRSDYPELSGISTRLVQENDTYTLAIDEKSIARDKGIEGYLSENIDQPGKIRDHKPDIGAYEYIEPLDQSAPTPDNTTSAPIVIDQALVFADNRIKTVAIRNTSGQLIFQKSNVINHCDIAGLANAVYLVTVADGYGQTTHKLVINIKK